MPSWGVVTLEPLAACDNRELMLAGQTLHAAQLGTAGLWKGSPGHPHWQLTLSVASRIGGYGVLGVIP